MIGGRGNTRAKVGWEIESCPIHNSFYVRNTFPAPGRPINREHKPHSHATPIVNWPGWILLAQVMMSRTCLVNPATSFSTFSYFPNFLYFPPKNPFWLKRRPTKVTGGIWSLFLWFVIPGPQKLYMLDFIQYSTYESSAKLKTRAGTTKILKLVEVVVVGLQTRRSTSNGMRLGARPLQ